MSSSVQVGLVEVYEGLRLFTTKDRMQNRKMPEAFTHDTEQAKDGDITQNSAPRLEQMQLI